MNYQFTRDIGSGASFSCLSKCTASTEADGKWLESPRNKTSVGNFQSEKIFITPVVPNTAQILLQKLKTHPLIGFLALQGMMNQQS